MSMPCVRARFTRAARSRPVTAALSSVACKCGAASTHRDSMNTSPTRNSTAHHCTLPKLAGASRNRTRQAPSTQRRARGLSVRQGQPTKIRKILDLRHGARDNLSYRGRSPRLPRRQESRLLFRSSTKYPCSQEFPVCMGSGRVHNGISIVSPVRYRCHDNEVSASFLSGLQPAGRGEAMVLAFLDLGALALHVMRHALALRFSSAIDGRIGYGVIHRVDGGGCGVVRGVPHFPVDLGVATSCHLHCRDDSHLCSW